VIPRRARRLTLLGQLLPVAIVIGGLALLVVVGIIAGRFA